MSDLPKHVHVKEVGPREGFQFEKGDISLAAKISLVDALSDTGVGESPLVGAQRRAGARNRVPGARVDCARDVARPYWTVMTPFIPIARCGVQWKLYLPGFTFASEIV